MRIRKNISKAVKAMPIGLLIENDKRTASDIDIELEL